MNISTHALREEGDGIIPDMTFAQWQFLPTPSARRATLRYTVLNRRRDHISTHALREEGDGDDLAVGHKGLISTHALREEGDPQERSTIFFSAKYFYPRPPRGGRPGHKRRAGTTADFYPRPPRGGRHFYKWAISSGYNDFYPRPPRGGRPAACKKLERVRPISTHALREEADTLPHALPN